MPSLFDFFCIAAAAFTVTRGWFRSDYFAARREHARELRDDEKRLRRLVGYLFTCPLCLSTQAAGLVSIPLLASLWLPEPWHTAVKTPLYVLAAAAFVPYQLVEKDMTEKESQEFALEIAKMIGESIDGRADIPVAAGIFRTVVDGETKVSMTIFVHKDIPEDQTRAAIAQMLCTAIQVVVPAPEEGSSHDEPSQN